MAAPRRNRSQKDDPLFRKTREKILVGQLVDRLQKNALGTLTKNSGKPKGKDYEEEYIELSPSQLKSMEILLNKTMPNLQSTELKGDPDKPLNTAMQVTFQHAKPPKK